MFSFETSVRFWSLTVEPRAAEDDHPPNVVDLGIRPSVFRKVDDVSSKMRLLKRKTERIIKITLVYLAVNVYMDNRGNSSTNTELYHYFQFCIS